MLGGSFLFPYCSPGTLTFEITRYIYYDLVHRICCCQCCLTPSCLVAGVLRKPECMPGRLRSHCSIEIIWSRDITLFVLNDRESVKCSLIIIILRMNISIFGRFGTWWNTISVGHKTGWLTANLSQLGQIAMPNPKRGGFWTAKKKTLSFVKTPTACWNGSVSCLWTCLGVSGRRKPALVVDHTSVSRAMEEMSS